MAIDEFFFTIAEMSTWLLIEPPPSERLQRFISNCREFSFSTPAHIFTIEVQIEPGELFMELVPGPLRVHTRLAGPRVEFVSCLEKGWFDLDQRRGRLVLRSEGDPENYLRVLYAWRCLEENGILLHASGIVRDQAAYVFFGPSGSGKTTTTTLTDEGLILSDDLVIIKPHPTNGKNGVFAFGVPFRGEGAEAVRTNACAPLKSIFRLRQDENHHVLSLPASKAVAELAASVPFVMEDPRNAGRVLKICQQIESRVPIKELHFRKDPGFWNAIYQSLS